MELNLSKDWYEKRIEKGVPLSCEAGCSNFRPLERKKAKMVRFLIPTPDGGRFVQDVDFHRDKPHGGWTFANDKVIPDSFESIEKAVEWANGNGTQTQVIEHGGI